MNKRVNTALLAGVIVLALAFPAWASFWTEGQAEHTPVVIDSQTVVKLAEKLKPAVVNIDTEVMVTMGGTPFNRNLPKDLRDYFERFFGGEGMPERKQRRMGKGSGFIITSDGYIVTNNHVVQEADKIVVKLLDEKEVYEAEVVGVDSKTDVALLKIEAQDLPFVVLGDSDKLKVGEWVIAIGNPFGLDSTVTAGIVSAKGRFIGAGPYDDFIQTDASINPGNSGGPLFNLYGEVVGMNTAIIAQGQGIGFAVPIKVVKEIISQLRDKGRVVRAELGVMIQPITPEIAESFGLDEPSGALISQIMPGSPAERAGLEPGDIIIEFNNEKVNDFNDLPRMVNLQEVGSKATVIVLREGKEKKLKVVLGESGRRAEVLPEAGPLVEPEEAPELGLSLQDLTPEIAEALGLEKGSGVVVAGVEPGSPADQAGLRRGDVVAEVNRKPVESTAEFMKAVAKADRDRPILLYIQRGEARLYIPLKQSEKG